MFSIKDGCVNNLPFLDKDITKVTVPAITEAIQAFRQGDYIIKPGGGGKYGQISFPKEKDILLLELENK